MKRLILFTLFIFPFFISAQNFPLVKDGGIWREFAGGGGFPPDPFWHTTTQFYIYGDTIIFNKSFKKVYRTDYDSIILNKLYVGAIHEDTIGRVYFLLDSTNNVFYPNPGFNDSVETVLYDFSLAVGDTFYIPNEIDSIQQVTSIDSVLISGQWRKRINFNQNLQSIRVWIKGIGDTKGLFFPGQVEFFNVQFLTCYEDSQIFWTNPDWGSDCLSAGIEDELQITKDKLLIFPNPANDKITFDLKDLNKTQDLEIEIYNSVGLLTKKEKVTRNIQTKTIQIYELSSGIYFYRITSDSQFYFGKFVKL